MTPLHPHGTARQRSGATDDGFPSDLRGPLMHHDLGDESLYLAWALAHEAGLPVAEERALTLLVLASLASLRQGSTRLPLSGEEGAAHLDELWPALGGTPRERTLALELCAELRQARLAGKSARLDPIAGFPGERRPLILDGYALYHQRMHACELSLSSLLAARLAAPAAREAGALSAVLDDVCARPASTATRAIALTASQRRAVEHALKSSLSVITGGPGTGKTSIVAALLRALARLDVPPDAIALAAPTGKAAFRLRESITRSLGTIAEPAPADLALQCPEAQTLHRLLGYSPSSDRFRRHAGDPLSARVVIVDEASMIDLFLMERLVRAVRPDAQLVLLGDADQLPSVDAGAVLRDLVPKREPSVAVRLTESWRMSPDDPAGRHVLRVAGHVQAGDPAPILDGHAEDAIQRRANAAALTFSGVELLPASARGELMRRWYDERIQLGAELATRARREFALGPNGFGPEDTRELVELFAHSERARVLCVTRGLSRAGAARINRALHDRVLADARASGDAIALRSAPAFYPGEPVLMLHNDYDRGLWNGDQGLVLRVSEPGRPGVHFMAVFARESGFAAHPLESLRTSLQHAWATTVHKSQGSELDHVALLLPDEDLPLLQRELLYTAITRARRSVVVAGDEALLRKAIERRARRFSGLSRRLFDP
jgi:exodeoxyribonuclease V alpha subunit